MGGRGTQSRTRIDVLNRTTEQSTSHPADAPAGTPGKGRKKSPKKESDPAISRLITYFHDEHLRIIGEKPHIVGGRDGAAIKRMLGTFPEEELRARIFRYLQDPLEWMDRPQHTITGFEKRVNAYSDRNAADDTADTSWDEEY